METPTRKAPTRDEVLIHKAFGPNVSEGICSALLALDDAANQAIDQMRAGHVMDAEQTLRAALLPRDATP